MDTHEKEKIHRIIHNKQVVQKQISKHKKKFKFG